MLSLLVTLFTTINPTLCCFMICGCWQKCWFCFWGGVWRSISEDSLRRYVYFASENCIQELLSASDQSRADTKDAWKVLALDDGVEISKRRSGSLHIFRSRWLLTSVSPQQFITVANAIDAAKVNFNWNFISYAWFSWGFCSILLLSKHAFTVETVQGKKTEKPDEEGHSGLHGVGAFII